jgi:CubicO group peptidase (beta-lactamase class C family)
MVRFGLVLSAGALLQPGTVQLLQTPQRLSSGQETTSGLGWDVGPAVIDNRQTRWVGRNGSLLGGMVTSLMIFPEHGVVVSAMSNISYSDTQALVLAIGQAFAERRSPDGPPD